ncbi:MAG: flagellar protein FliT [Methylococcales bacterium]
MSDYPENTEGTQAITATLSAYLAELEHCLRDEKWELLSDVLDRRQGYFENLFDRAEGLDSAWLNAMIKQVLLEDNAMVTRITLQKDRVEQERLTLMRSRQAVKAYL